MSLDGLFPGLLREAMKYAKPMHEREWTRKDTVAAVVIVAVFLLGVAGLLIAFQQ